MLTEAEILDAFVDDFTKREQGVALQSTMYEPQLVIDGRTCPPDALIKVQHDYDDRTRLFVIEAKRTLTSRLVEQCQRWLPFDCRAMAVVAEPKARSTQHNARRAVLISCGIGLYYITPEKQCVMQFTGSVRRKGARRLEFSEQMETHGPKQGGVKAGEGGRRVRADAWAGVRAQLREADYPLTLKELRFDRKPERLRFAKDVERGDVVDIEEVPYTLPRQYRLK